LIRLSIRLFNVNVIIGKMSQTVENLDYGNGINPTNDILSDNSELVEKFEHMGLKKTILRGIFSYGYEDPSPIQKRAIPIFLKGTDIIAQAQSGTGKTATFSISILQSIDEDIKSVQSIIISPTRELSEQIYTVIRALASYTKIRFSLLLGGLSRSDQINSLREGAQCVICTPGRFNDFLHNGCIDISNVKHLVLDEADELLTPAFINQIRNVVEILPNKTQICLFSATLPPYCHETAERFLVDPEKITVRKEQLTLDGITQYYIATENDKCKYDAITDLYSSMIINQLIIYCNTKQRVIYLAENLVADGHTCTCIHSDLTTNERMNIMYQFRKGDSRVLISTDLLSRGIDVQQVSLVINYDIPRNIESYIHRIGRSGRFGRKGIALNFISANDRETMRRIEQFYCTEINELPSNVDNLFNQK